MTQLCIRHLRAALHNVADKVAKAAESIVATIAVCVVGMKMPIKRSVQCERVKL